MPPGNVIDPQMMQHAYQMMYQQMLMQQQMMGTDLQGAFLQAQEGNHGSFDMATPGMGDIACPECGGSTVIENGICMCSACEWPLIIPEAVEEEDTVS